MSLNLSISADPNYGIVGTISSNATTEITANVTGTSLALDILNAQAFSTYNINWNNQAGFAGYFLPGQTYGVYASDSSGNSVSASVTMPAATLTINFTTGTAYANISLSAINTILGTTYGSLTRYWDGANSSNVYVLTTTTALSQNIKANAFQGQNPAYIKSIKDYGSVASVGNYAFVGANQMTSLIMPYTSQFGNSSFENCVALSTINIAALTTAGTQCFAGIDISLGSVTMRGSTSTGAILGSVPAARYIPTYLIGVDTFPSAVFVTDKITVNTGTQINVQTSATNIPDGFVFTASIYSSQLKSFYSTSTLAPFNAGLAIGSITVPTNIPNTDTIYIVYDYQRSIWPQNPQYYDGSSLLYRSGSTGVPQSSPIQVVPTVVVYPTPIAADVDYTVSFASPAVPIPLNVTGAYNTASILTPLSSALTPHTGSVFLSAGNTVIEYQPDPIFHGEDSFNYLVVNPSGVPSNSATVRLTVLPPPVTVGPPTITTPSTNIGKSFINTFTASSGTKPYSIELASGTLPPGLTLSQTSTTYAVLTGSSTVVGTYRFSIQATDSSYPPVTAESPTYTIQVFPAQPNGKPTTFSISENSASKIVPLNFDSTPASVSIVTPPTHGTTQIAGSNVYYQPTPGYSGVDSFTFRGSNVSGTGSTGTATINVIPSTVVFSLATGTQLLSGIVKKPYQAVTISASGGYGNYTFSAVGLPPGMTLTNATFSGTPTVIGLFYPIITVHDSGVPNLYSTTTFVLDILSGPTTIGADSYNRMEAASEGITKLVQGLYNNIPYSNSATVGQTILASDWTKLYQDIQRCYVHQHGPGQQVDVPIATVGTKVLALTTASLIPKIDNLITSFSSVAPGQLTEYSYSFSTATTTSTIGGLNFSWPDKASAHAFFNLGGYIKSDFDNSVFTLTNYSESVYTVVTGTIQTVTGGNRQIFIEGGGDSVTFVVDLVADPTNNPVSTSGTVKYYVSNADTGGVAATPPFVQVVTNNAGPVFTPPKLLFVYGNNLTSSTIQVKNLGLVPVNILSVTAVDDTNFSAEPLTFSYSLAMVGGGTIATNQQGPIVIYWQNNNENGGRGFYVNSVRITYSQGAGNIQTVIVPTPVQTFFGIKPIPGVPIYHTTATTNYFIPYTFKGYGGVLDTSYVIQPRVAPWSRGFLISSYGPTAFQPNLPPITVELNTNLVPNNPNGAYTSTVAIFSGRDTYNEYATTSTPISIHVDSVDRHIGSWFSAQNAANGVIGMSYDIINGERCLTIGFGMGSGFSNQIVVDASGPNGYSAFSGNGTNKAIKQLSGKFLGIPRNFTRYSGTSTTETPVIQDYGVWNPVAYGSTLTNNTVFNNTYAFMVRNSYDYRYQADGNAATSFHITGTNNGVVTNQTINAPGGVTVNGSITLQAGYYTINISCPVNNTARPAVAFRLYDHYLPAINPSTHYQDGSNVWTTLDTIVPTWADITRIPLVMDGNPVVYQPRSTLYSYNLASGVPYGDFFANRSMFTIRHDGYGGLDIAVNAIDHLSGQAIVDQTLINVSYLMYYYSNYEPSAGFNNRYNNIGGNGSYTPYFKGFDKDGNVITTTVATPAALPPGTSSDPNLLFAASVIAESIQLIQTLAAGGELTFGARITTGGLAVGQSVETAGQVYENIGESIYSLDAAYIDVAALALTILGQNNEVAKALSDAYMAISAVGVAATLLEGASLVVVAGEAGFFATGVAVVVEIFSTGFFCFTDSTLVDMADGTQKPIGKVQIGDQVFNHDKTEINTVTFVIGAIYTGELCSPSAQVAPFGSPQHPMIIDGKAYSYDVEHTKNEYPWLGDIQPLNKAATAQVVRKPVVNLLVTGDGTYRANGFGTTAVMGDGGNLVKRWQNGEISILEVYGTLRRYHNMGGLPLLEFYHTNKL